MGPVCLLSVFGELPLGVRIEPEEADDGEFGLAPGERFRAVEGAASLVSLFGGVACLEV